ncbi:HD domain-containing protein [Ovoidimarina sediminis]|uniref:HD domain-containing protein n=1 Tax=Ovoidimarina sediminis TaxID=3079856 RepID=UPI0029093299|nr:HD domain-containing protein [Rhodophyticola sp. MJ-SS7]MDU8945540.1 hypothetical protein [Rhodophyticola sp. MJ-SS7]
MSTYDAGGELWSQTIVSLVLLADKAGWTDNDLKRLWTAYDLAIELFSGRCRGSGRPFICHLVGTSALALRYGGSKDEVIAALLHAAYPQGDFGTAINGFNHKKSTEMELAVGHKVERLLNLYSTTDAGNWLLEMMQRQPKSISEEERSVIFIRLVNELEDAFDLTVYPPDRARIVRRAISTALRAANHFSLDDVAAGLQEIEHMNESTRFEAETSFVRRFESYTVIPRSAMRRPSVRLRSRLRRASARLRSRLRRIVFERR